MDANHPGAALDSLISSFNTRIAELQELVIARNMYPASTVADLSAIDAAVKAMELQVQQIKNRLRDEMQAIPKAKKLIEASLQQQRKLQSMSVYVPSSYLPERATYISHEPSKLSKKFNVNKEEGKFVLISFDFQEKKSRSSPPMWYVTSEELDSLSSYMRGRLTLEKVNAAISDMAAYAQANAQLVTAPRKKISDSVLEKALELRNIAETDLVKGKHFFLESDIKGPALKLDNTGKSILTVLRHLGRISETRIGHNRVIILMKPQ
ncbi:spindle and kinetochore-associated protein 1 homolog [Impatiens glandulifera]|uniref:spindle and kinetochore-associated protein 1 homolog n=1 Tax=Impatiens glandulifera TaxID=253017 RepID=UPI001FB15451|nr:spindle and kinetochore-associated protein 1 homolog [Impatiens glandulifera]